MKRRPGMSKKDFVDHYLTQHISIVKTIPGIKRYVVNISIGDDQPFDAVAELYFSDLDSYNRSQETPERGEAYIDEQKFMDMRNIISLATEEHLIL